MELLGHRGAVDLASPENTLASIDRALTGGADGVEVDVRLTSDGVLVCHHDASLRRTTGDPRHIAGTTADEIAELRVAEHAVPRLAEVLELVGDRGRLVVEVKSAPRPTQWPAGATTCTAEATVVELKRHPVRDVVVSSFDRPRMHLVRDAGLRTALLTRPGVPFAVAARRALADRHAEAHVHSRSVLADLDLVSRAHDRGLAITAWTVDRCDDLRRMAEAGVDTAICDDPLGARAVLQDAALAS